MRQTFFAAATVALLLLTSCTSNKGSFSLVNKAKEPIARATVAICGQTFELKDIPPTKSAGGTFKVTCENHYTIEVELRSGKKLRKKTGYVTSGMDFQHEIVVTDSDVDIGDTKVK